tara:strand:+ start:632 stop:1036 length:405 start_codon:yes stop_codon:yes gene_type:complete
VTGNKIRFTGIKRRSDSIRGMGLISYVVILNSEQCVAQGVVACLSVYTEGARTRVARRNVVTGPRFVSIISTDTTVVYALQIYTVNITARNTTAGNVTPTNSVNTILEKVNVRNVMNRNYKHRVNPCKIKLKSF